MEKRRQRKIKHDCKLLPETMFLMPDRSIKSDTNKIFAVLLLLTLGILTFLFIRTGDNNVTKRTPIYPTIAATATPTPSLTPKPTYIPTRVPSPIPTSTTIPASPTLIPSNQFESYFDEFSAHYNVNKELLKKIALCESGLNPGSVNGEYGGMYQFTIETWRATRNQMGADANPDLRFDASESIKTAAYKISNKGENAWVNCL